MDKGDGEGIASQGQKREFIKKAIEELKCFTWILPQLQLKLNPYAKSKWVAPLSPSLLKSILTLVLAKINLFL